MELKLNLREKVRHNQAYYCYGSRPLLCASQLQNIFPNAANNLILYIYTKPSKNANEQRVFISQTKKEWFWRSWSCDSGIWYSLAPAANVFLSKLVKSDTNQSDIESIYLSIKNII
jgi:hypothetical protein